MTQKSKYVPWLGEMRPAGSLPDPPESPKYDPPYVFKCVQPAFKGWNFAFTRKGELDFLLADNLVSPIFARYDAPPDMTRAATPSKDPFLGISANPVVFLPDLQTDSWVWCPLLGWVFVKSQRGYISDIEIPLQSSGRIGPSPPKSPMFRGHVLGTVGGFWGVRSVDLFANLVPHFRKPRTFDL